VPPRQWKLRITDILDSIAAVQEYLKGMDLEAFLRDPRTMDAVKLQFIIVGEAANNVPATIVQAHPEIPWRRMRQMRNVVVHDYPGVRMDMVWDTIQNDLPPLVEPLKSLLDEPD
jgi:uncharacterized protein with HEPN domain